MYEEVPASDFDDVVRYFERNGWRVTRRDQTRCDALLCRPRPWSLGGALARLFGQREQCQHVWVARDGLVHNEWA